ncbi:MAG: hypothetical protein GY729_06210 [Desulfobacteraceae bacterium]|nr:hypothetical protein [Desulfobacteraceae bacterium]
MKKTLMILTAVLFVFSGSAFAQVKIEWLKGVEKAPIYRWWMDIHPARQFKITPKEVEKLDAVYKRTMTNLIEWKLTAKKAILELEMEMGKLNYDADLCLENFKKIQGLRSTMAIERLKYFKEMREIIGNQRFMHVVEATYKQIEHNKRMLQERRTPVKTPEKKE